MKKLIAVVLLCTVPHAAPAHPGKTDRYGGHKCMKGCEEWKLYYAEYHLHDKEMRPIRINRRSKTDTHAVRTAASLTDVRDAGEVPRSTETVTVTVYRYIPAAREEAVPFNPLLWALLVLLLLLLIIRLNRKRSR